MAELIYVEASEYEEREAVFGADDAGKRLDIALAERFPDLSRSRIQSIIENGLIRPEGLSKNTRVKPGFSVVLTVNERVPLAAAPEEIEIDIVYEDDDLLVVNKPRGMVVHPAKGNTSGTLVNALLGRYATDSAAPDCSPEHNGEHNGDGSFCVAGAKAPRNDGIGRSRTDSEGGLSSINGPIRPGIVHRIDKNTSGLLVVAKNDAAHTALAEQFAAHTISRRYQAIVIGGFKEEEGKVDAPIGRDQRNRLKQAVVSEGGRRAVTHWRAVRQLSGRYGVFTLMEIELETGRTHQIRVHMAYIGHPVLGDVLYGQTKGPFAREGQCLHAGLLGFDHPSSGERVTFESPPPAYFTDMLEKLQL